MYKKQLESLTREEWRELVEFRELFEFLDALVPMGEDVEGKEVEGKEAKEEEGEEVKHELNAGDKRPRCVGWCLRM